VSTPPARPLTVAELARTLEVQHSTLRRALLNDPAAPGPAAEDDRGRPLYDHATIIKWWPNRRRRGKPPATPQGAKQPCPNRNT
jgi:hypothetical protein